MGHTKTGRFFFSVFLGGISLFMFLSCGYQFSGSGSLPEEIQTLSVEIFENRTTETRLENIISNDLIREFTRRDKKLITDKNSAQAYLTGVITSIPIETISHATSTSSAERRVTVNLDVKLISNKDQTVIWERKQVSDNEAYDVDSDRFITDQNRRDALEEISERLSESIYKLLTDNF